MNHIAVFCGSRSGKSEVYVKEAARLGKELAERGIGLVYGGSSAGVMGAVADAVMENGGQVTGIMPEFLEKREIAHKNLTQLVVVDSMHERKAKMAELADGFMVLPGGAGTLEEFLRFLHGPNWDCIKSRSVYLTPTAIMTRSFRCLTI